jgi:hypothetical protein
LPRYWRFYIGVFGDVSRVVVADEAIVPHRPIGDKRCDNDADIYDYPYMCLWVFRGHNIMPVFADSVQKRHL